MKKFLYILVIPFMLVTACTDERFVQQGNTQYFLQDFNPEFLDVIWVVDDRSPMYKIRNQLIKDATRFFTRLDQVAADYQMGFINADTQFSSGQLKPSGNPSILTKQYGTAAERAQNFSTLISQVINLGTGPVSRGFGSVELSLKNHFVPRQGVPLVIVFISDSDDHSDEPSGTTDSVEYWSGQLLSLKENNENLIRVYSVNLEELGSGESRSATNRCTTLDHADIDKPDFNNDYFLMAERFNGSTADLCKAFRNADGSSWADDIDLSGLRLIELPNRFKLNGVPVEGSIVINVTRNGAEVAIPSWVYDSSTNEVVFDTAPEQGTTVSITFHSQG